MIALSNKSEALELLGKHDESVKALEEASNMKLQ